MERIDGYETTDEEVMQNRLLFRNYIRELILNQQRVMERIASEEGGEDVLQELTTRSLSLQQRQSE